MESSGHDILDEAALKAVNKWIFFSSGAYILDKPVTLTQPFALILQK
jgi:outer membrane biosynthesis protein TonB